MAVTVVTNSLTSNYPSSENGATLTASGSWSDPYNGYATYYAFTGVLSEPNHTSYSGGLTWTKAWNNLASDTTFSTEAWAQWTFDNSEGFGGVITTKSYAMTAGVGNSGGPASSNVAQTTATIQCYFNVRTHESTATVWLEYKKNADAVWTTAGATVPNQSGFNVNGVLISRDLSGLTPNTLYDFRLRMTRTTENATDYTGTAGNGGAAQFTTLLADPVLTTTAATSVTQSSATLNGTVNPNNKSTACYLDWDTASKSPPGTTYANSVYVATYADGTVHPLATTVTGLNYSTTYYFRAKGIYNGVTYWASTEQSFTTSAPPATPDITTNAATGVGPTTVTLNGTVNPNTHSTTYYFEWGLTVAYGNTTAAQGPSTASSPFPFSQSIGSLTENTLYHFRAVAFYNATAYNGADQTFTTSQTPIGGASLEEHTGQYEFERPYGVALTAAAKTQLDFVLYAPKNTSGNLFYVDAAPATNECFVFKDGAYYAQTVDSVVKAANGLYYLTLSAAALQSEVTDVVIHSATGLYRDVHLQVRTIRNIGRIEVDASAMAAATSSWLLTGATNGKSIQCLQDIYTAGKLQAVGNLAIGGNLAVVGNIGCVNLAPTGNFAVTGNITAAAMTISGALTAASIVGPVIPGMGILTGTAQSGISNAVTLDSNASASDGFYTGAIIMITAGPGEGQYRHITDYKGSLRQATVNSTWYTIPGAGSKYVIIPGDDMWGGAPAAELSALSHNNSTESGVPLASYAEMIQSLYQWFLYRHDHLRPSPAVNQNVAHKLYKSGGALLTYFDITDAGAVGGTHAPVTGVYNAGDFVNKIWRKV